MELLSANKKNAVAIWGMALGLMVAAGVMGCSGGDVQDKYASSSAVSTYVGERESAKVADYGWVKFDIPEGYRDTRESKTFPVLVNVEDPDYVIKVLPKPFLGDVKTIDDLAAEKTAREFYLDDGTKKVGDREWRLVGFKWIKKAHSQFAYTKADDSHAVILASFMMTADDPVVEGIMKTMEIDTSKI